MKQYQVIFLEPKFVEPEKIFELPTEQFFAEDMQNTLNTYAEQGWRVISCAPQTDSYGKTIQFVVVLEKDAE